MGLVDQVKSKLNIGNHDDAPTNQGAPTSTTHHQTTARKSLSSVLSMPLKCVLLSPENNHKASFPRFASGGQPPRYRYAPGEPCILEVLQLVR